MELGKIIKQARIKKGYSQDALAKMIGYKSRSSINKIETGEREIPNSILYKITQILDISFSDLVYADVSAVLKKEAQDRTNPYQTTINKLLNLGEDGLKVAIDLMMKQMTEEGGFEEKELLHSFRSLNKEGKVKVLDYISKLETQSEYLQ